MGYESRIYVVNRNDDYDETIAMFNLSKIDYDLLEVCQTREYHSPNKCYGDKRPTDLYIGCGIKSVKEDCYGKVPTECNAKDFYTQLLKSLAEDRYRRYEMLIGFLTPMINSKSWNELIIVHTGY